MRAIEVVADLRALNQWAQESCIASEAEDPRRAPHSARGTNSEHLGSEFGRPSSSERSERGLSKSLPLSQLSQERASVARSSTTTSDRISEVFRGVRSSSRLAESDIAERSRDISRSSTRKSTLELPRSSNRPSTSPTSPSRPSALTDMPALPASDPLSSLPKLLRQISAATDDSQAPSGPSGFDLALQDAISSTSRATATYANNQLVLVPQDCAARQTPKMRKLWLGLVLHSALLIGLLLFLNGLDLFIQFKIVASPICLPCHFASPHTILLFITRNKLKLYMSNYIIAIGNSFLYSQKGRTDPNCKLSFLSCWHFVPRKADLLRTHPWLQELQRAAESGFSGSVPGSPVNRLQPPQAVGTVGTIGIAHVEHVELGENDEPFQYLLSAQERSIK